MPKVKISVDDLRQMYENSLVIYKNKPVFIKKVENTFTFHVFDLTIQRNVVVKIEEYDEFKAPGRHLGFVNAGQYVVYISRKPVRRYRVGLSADSFVATAPEGHTGILGHHLLSAVYQMTAPELADTVFGRYPTITECFQGVRNGVYTIVAFDRQFAMDKKGNIYYKTKKVGSVKVEPKSVYDITFTDGNEHLITLLDTNYEKSTPTARV